MLDSAFNLIGTAVPIYFHTNEVRSRTGNRGYRLVATSETYQTLDGHIAIGANHQHQIEALCDVLGCGWLLKDARFATHKDRVRNHEALRAALAEAGRTTRVGRRKSALARPPDYTSPPSGGGVSTSLGMIRVN